MNGGLDGDIALHINPRHDLGHVVRNSRLSGAWGREELCATPPLPFAPGQDFELVIFCTESCYLMSVNGRHLASFATRSALSAVRTLHVDGTVQLTGIEYSDGVKQYPPLPAPALALADRPGGGYHADKPLFPCRLPEPMQEGGVIQLTGRVRLLPFSFFVNLLHGSQLFPEPDILLHFNPRFQVLDCFEVIVANSRVAGWGKEQIVQDFPFRAGRHFVIRIVCQPGSWDVFVDGRLLLKFPHRLSKSLLDAVEVRGDVIVESVHFEPNSKDLIQF
ncbi:galectin-4-like isoform X2 [Pollicipes pollicipes]|nr:galectin-4-like isoform X2 [Pollicipes pollicipes]